MLLIAIPENENAKNVSWFYFSSLASITKWLNEIICTLPKRHRQLFESTEDDYETNISFKNPKYPVVKTYDTPKVRGTSKKHSQNDSYTLNQMLHLYGFGNLFLITQNYGFDDSVYCYGGNKNDPSCYNGDNNDKHCLDHHHNNIDGYHNCGSDTNNANHNNHDYCAIINDTSHHTSTHFNDHTSHNFYGGISHDFGSSGTGHSNHDYSSHGGGFSSSHDYSSGGGYSSGGCDFSSSSGGGGGGGCGGGF